MAALQIRDFPPELHRLLTERAKSERRTIAQEATVLLAGALAAPANVARRRAMLAEIRRTRKPVDFTRHPTPEQLVREDRAGH